MNLDGLAIKKLYAKIPQEFKMKLIETLFDGYIKSAYGDQQLPPTQLSELRKCFYAAMWAAIHEIRTCSETLPEAAAVDVLERLSAESKEHVQDVLARWYKTN